MTNHCPRCGLDSLRYWEGAPLHCTDPSCEWPKVARA